MKQLCQNHSYKYRQLRIGIFLAAALFFARGVLGTEVFGQGPSSESASEKPQTRPLAPEQRKHHENRIKEMKQLLNEANEGKRDDTEKYVILRHLLQNYATLDAMETPEAKEALGQWKDLLKGHPEFKKNPPREIKEQREMREKPEVENKRLEGARKTWVPSDIKPVGRYQHGNHIIFYYQYRLEFYELAAGESDAAAYKFISASGRDVSKKPKKTITFAHVIEIEPSGFRVSPKALLVCTDPLLGYHARTPEEEEITQDRRYHWRRPNSDYEEFCGIIGFDGEILGRIDAGPSTKEHYVRPLGILPDGKEALVGIGPADFKNDRGLPDSLKYEELLHWTAPNQTKRLLITNMTESEIGAYKKKFKHPIYHGSAQDFIDLRRRD